MQEEQQLSFENPKEIGEELVRDEKGRFVEGHPDVGAGRPLGSFSLKTMLEKEIQKQPDGQKVSYAMALIKKQLHQAIIEGDVQTQKLIWNYIDGLPHQTTDITSGGKPIPLLTNLKDVSDNDSNKEDSETQE